MPNKHRHSPISLRLPKADRAWLFAYAAQTGIPVNRILADALAVFRADLLQHVSGNCGTTAATQERQSDG